MGLWSTFGGEGGNRTHIAGFSDRCIDQLCYLPLYTFDILPILSIKVNFESQVQILDLEQILGF